MRSRPGISLSNFTQCTICGPGFAGALEVTGSVGPRESSAICILHRIDRTVQQFSLSYNTKRLREIQTCRCAICGTGIVVCPCCSALAFHSGAGNNACTTPPHKIILEEYNF